LYVRKLAIAVALLIAIPAFANGVGNDNPASTGTTTNTNTATGGAGGNGGVAYGSTNNNSLVGGNFGISATNGPVSATGGKAEQGQVQGQKQGQAQKATAKQSQSADNNGNTQVVNEAKNAAASAPSAIVAVASSCGGSAAAGGQGFSGGGVFGFAFEFYDCKVIREAAFLITLGQVEAGLQHVCNIERMKDSLELSTTFRCKTKPSKAAFSSKAGRS